MSAYLVRQSKCKGFPSHSPNPDPQAFAVAINPRFSALRAMVEPSSCVETVERERSGKKMGLVRPHPTAT